MTKEEAEWFERLTEDEQLKYCFALELDAARYEKKILSEYWGRFKKDWEAHNMGFYVRLATYCQYFQVKLPQRESLSVTDWKNGKTETISDKEFEDAYVCIINDFINNYRSIFKLYGNDSEEQRINSIYLEEEENEDDNDDYSYDDTETYDRYGGPNYNGERLSDNFIDDVLDGNPDAYWNID